MQADDGLLEIAHVSTPGTDFRSLKVPFPGRKFIDFRHKRAARCRLPLGLGRTGLRR
jgi:hypothetical protein